MTYDRDVAPILQRRCLQCHTAEGPGHLPLETYEQAHAWSRAIREQVLERRMPPWPAADGFADYSNQHSLSPLEIELLASWADGGAPLGAAPSKPAPSGANTAPAEGRVVHLPALHPSRGTERIELRAGNDEDVWISGWQLQPERPAELQHAVLSIGGLPLGSWVPGDETVRFPAGVSQRLPRQGRLTIDLHYGKSAEADVPGGTLTLLAGERGRPLRRRVVPCSDLRLQAGMELLAITPAAPAGDSIEIVGRRPDRTVVPLCVIPRAQPSYPVSYRFREPPYFPAGSVLAFRTSNPSECSATLEFTARTPGRAGAPSR